MNGGQRTTLRIPVRLCLRRRLELTQKLRRDPGGSWRWCWWHAGFVQRLAREVVHPPPLTEAERFELDVLSDIYALPEVGAGLAA